MRPAILSWDQHGEGGLTGRPCRGQRHTVASWTPRGVTTVLDEPRPVEVFHDGCWYAVDLTAYRQDRAWWGMVRFVRRGWADALAHGARALVAAARSEAGDFGGRGTVIAWSEYGVCCGGCREVLAMAWVEPFHSKQAGQTVLPHQQHLLRGREDPPGGPDLRHGGVEVVHALRPDVRGLLPGA